MRSTITREGVYFLFVVLVVLIGSLVREINAMLLFAAFLCAPMVIAWRLGRRSLQKLSVQRRLPTQVFAGEPFIVHVETSNNLPRRRFALSSWGIVVVDRIRPIRHDDGGTSIDEMPYEPAVYFEYIPVGQSVRKTYAGRLPRRGRYRIGSIQIQTRFPFGFFRHATEQETAENEQKEFCVYPKLGRITTNWRARHHETVESRQHQRFFPSRGSGEFLGVRQWQQGDTKKWIHWRASAKYGKPFVRQFEKNQNHDCAILIDLFRERKPKDADTERHQENFELAVSFTATLVSDMTRCGAADLFFATSCPKEACLSGPISLPLVDSILCQLALAEQDKEDSLPEKLLQSLSAINPQADLILVTPQPLDLNNSPRFARFRNDPRFRSIVQRLRIIDTSSKKLDNIFTLESE